ncbi:MAG: type I glyceraldehyde-3-phosphate dehydrogenase [Chitinophagaceae bacterium]|nr:MAG: type I glyceraldehyde-3-phosphate dehydrogenase [Chitinophagaceae bacterium]
MRVAINGMGRIGRLIFRRLFNDPAIELVAVNDIMDPQNLLYLLKYDSVYGTFPDELTLAAGNTINGRCPVRVLQNPQPVTLPWKELEVDVVIESSGRFSSRVAAGEHLLAGARKVLLSTTGSDDIPLMIYGFNQAGISKDTDIISPGGCMTNCSVHLLYILNAIGIETAQLHFLHSYTSRQELVDAPHKEYRRGRAAAESIIPVPIDLHHSLERVMPGLKGKLLSLSTRIPVANGAMADFTVQLSREASVQEINKLFRVAAAGEYKGILDYTDEELVSLDYKGNTHSCVVDGSLTSVVGRHLKLIAWFDNEYGFTSRMIDWLHYWKASGF